MGNLQSYTPALNATNALVQPATQSLFNGGNTSGWSWPWSQQNQVAGSNSWPWPQQNQIGGTQWNSENYTPVGQQYNALQQWQPYGTQQPDVLGAGIAQADPKANTITIQMSNGRSVTLAPDNKNRIYFDRVRGANSTYLTVGPKGTIYLHGNNGGSIPLQNDGQGRVYLNFDSLGNAWVVASH